MQRVFIGALCRQMSRYNQSERDAIFGRDSYERKLSNHHEQGHRQGATAIIEFFTVTHTSKNFEGARGRLCSSKGRACATAQWHNGQSKPG